MEIFFLVVIIIAVIIGASKLLGGGADLGNRKVKPKYRYQKKNFFMSKAEHECYKALIKALGDRFCIFAQVHLSTIVDHKIKGQSWKGAFSHINRKSVDFVLCEKEYISPILAIELDDSSHERPDRQKRDCEVERILDDAGVSLLRIKNHGRFDPEVLNEKVNIKLSQ